VKLWISRRTYSWRHDWKRKGLITWMFSAHSVIVKTSSSAVAGIIIVHPDLARLCFTCNAFWSADDETKRSVSRKESYLLEVRMYSGGTVKTGGLIDNKKAITEKMSIQ
jgi:hypothetical protein